MKSTVILRFFTVKQQFGLAVQVSLVICGLFICKFVHMSLIAKWPCFRNLFRYLHPCLLGLFICEFDIGEPHLLVPIYRIHRGPPVQAKQIVEKDTDFFPRGVANIFQGWARTYFLPKKTPKNILFLHIIFGRPARGGGSTPLAPSSERPWFSICSLNSQKTMNFTRSLIDLDTEYFWSKKES